MANNTSHIKHFTGGLTPIFVIIMLLISSLSAPLLVSGKAAADTPTPVCEISSSNPSDALEAPALLTPANDSTNPNGFDFSWGSVNGAAQYDWQSSLTPDVNTDGSFTNQLAYHRLNTTSINEGGSPQMTYFWHVRAVASDGSTGQWSQTWKSTISNTQTSYLGAPSMLFPGNGATCNIYSQDFDFSWNAPTTDGGLSPLTYIFQSGKSATTNPNTGEFTDQPWTDYNIPTTRIFDGGSQNATYYWHVRAVGSDGTLGPWSTTSVVTITRDAPAPVDPPIVTPPTTTPTAPVNTPTTPDASTPITTALSETTPLLSTESTVSLFIPPSADIAAVLGTGITPSSKTPAKKTPAKANLAADIATAHPSRVVRNVIWIVALAMIIIATVFGLNRRQQNSSK